MAATGRVGSWRLGASEVAQTRLRAQRTSPGSCRSATRPSSLRSCFESRQRESLERKSCQTRHFQWTLIRPSSVCKFPPLQPLLRQPPARDSHTKKKTLPSAPYIRARCGRASAAANCNRAFEMPSQYCNSRARVQIADNTRRTYRCWCVMQRCSW